MDSETHDPIDLQTKELKYVLADVMVYSLIVWSSGGPLSSTPLVLYFSSGEVWGTLNSTVLKAISEYWRRRESHTAILYFLIACSPYNLQNMCQIVV